jgi:hypothetical protein
MQVSDLPLISATLNYTEGNKALAKYYLNPLLHDQIETVYRVVAILRNNVPSCLYTDGMKRDVKVGDLFASRLGLSKLYRSVSKAIVSDAIKALKSFA